MVLYNSLVIHINIFACDNLHRNRIISQTTKSCFILIKQKQYLLNVGNVSVQTISNEVDIKRT